MMSELRSYNILIPALQIVNVVGCGIPMVCFRDTDYSWLWGDSCLEAPP